MSSQDSNGSNSSRNGYVSTSESAKTRSKSLKRSMLTSVEGSNLDISSDYMCPVCLNLLNEPFMTTCGHTFCRICLMKSIESNRRCPKCTFTIYSSENVFPNHLVNEQIEKYKRTNGSPINKLKKIFSNEVSHLKESDLTDIIKILQEKKAQIEATSEHIKNDLLKTFLSELQSRKKEQRIHLEKELEWVKADLDSIQNDSDLSSIFTDNTEDQEAFQIIPPKPGGYTSLAFKRSKIRMFFDELSELYFSDRSPGLNTFNPNVASTSQDIPELNSEVKRPLNEFGDCITKLTQYYDLRPLATIDAGDKSNAMSYIASSIEFDKDCEILAVAGLTKKIKLYDYNTVISSSCDYHDPSGEMVCEAKISCVSWSSYHKSLLVSSDYEGTVTLWDAVTAKRLIVYHEHQKRCWSVDFNKVDTKIVASGSDDAKVKLWHLHKNKSIFSLDAKVNVCCVQFDPWSRYHLAFGCADHCVHYYDLRYPKEPLRKFQGHRKAVSYVKFLSRGELVSASTDNQLKVWKVDSPSAVQSLRGHSNEKNFVGLATDGDYVACGSENNALFVYYKEMPRKLFSFKFEAPEPFYDKDVKTSAAAAIAEKEDDSNYFVSAVCWKKGSPILAAGNSQGLIKILQMV